jgi:integrase
MRDQHDGKKEISLGSSLSGAYQKFAEFTQTDECITLMRELLDRYRLEVVPEYESQNTRDSKHYSLDRLRPAMGDNLVTQITPQFIYKYRDHIARTRSKKQANLDLEVLSHCFTKAIQWGVIADHPMTNKKVTKFSLPGRKRYVDDWELEEWASVANPFLVAYIVLKGVTGLRQQDLLTIRNRDITDTDLFSENIKTGERQNFPLYDDEGHPTTAKLALDVVQKYYANFNAKRRVPIVSPWLFFNRKGTGYYNLETRKASGFQSIWQRSMKKAIAKTTLETSFTEHDLRAKVGSDIESLAEAQKLLAHTNAATTKKSYRRKGAKMTPAKGFTVVPK